MLTAAMALESWKDLFSSWEEPALDKQERLFSNRQLRQMLVPLFIEQILVVGLGLSDTFMVSFLGEAAVSGVALVDQVNLIFLYLFIALGAGGAVIVSQYLGAGDRKKGNQAAGQLLLSATVLSAVLALGMGLLHRSVLTLLFGQVEPAIMNAALLHLEICLFSYPALGIYHAGAAIQRSLGNIRSTMEISAVSNGLCVYYRHRTVHGGGPHPVGLLLFPQTDLLDPAAVPGLESGGAGRVAAAGRPGSGSCHVPGLAHPGHPDDRPVAEWGLERKTIDLGEMHGGNFLEE